MRKKETKPRMMAQMKLIIDMMVNVEGNTLEEALAEAKALKYSEFTPMGADINDAELFVKGVYLCD